MSLPAFYRGLAQLGRAGLVTGDALAQLHDAGTLKLPGLAEAVERGESLSAALAHHADKVPSEDVTLIEAGETTGELGACLERLARIHEHRSAMWANFRSKMRYPLLILHVAALCMPIALTTMKGWEPWTIGILATAWSLIGAVFVVRRTPEGRKRVRRFVDHLPLFGKAARHQRQSLFASVLAAGHDAGLTLDRAADVAGRAAHLERAVEAAPAVTAGTPLGAALAAKLALPPDLLARITTSEIAGELTPELERMATEEASAADRALERAVEYTTKGFYVALLLVVLFYALTILGRAYGV